MQHDDYRSLGHHRLGRHGPAVLAGLLFLCASGSARAQQFALDQLDPAPVGDRAFGVQSSDVRGDKLLRAQLLLSWAHDPLVLSTKSSDQEIGSVVGHQGIAHVAGSFALRQRYLFSLDVPVAVLQGGDNPTGGGTTWKSPATTQFGDVRVGARARLLGPEKDGLQLALALHLWLPTGASNSYVSDSGLRGSPAVVVGGVGNRLAWSAQAGMLFREGQKIAGTPVGNAVNFGAGLFYLVDNNKTIQVGPEIYGQTVVARGGSAFAANSTAAEALLDGRWRPGGGDWVVGAGAGPGVGQGAGAPGYRIVAMLAWSPEEPERADRDHDGVPDDEDACPDQAGVRTADPKTNGCPPRAGDADGDGVPDDQDACPAVAGVKTTDPKTNGCPPADKDGDGVPDSEDACPAVAGVKTADPKTNGCPPDKDEDGIPDAQDACPDVKGVQSDDPKLNGCPPDQDKDGIPDAVDACPKLPGIQNDEPKYNGCPRARIVVEENSIVITQQIQFEHGKAVIRPESEGILRDVLGILQAHPEIERVEVQGHTDNTGPAYINRQLSAQRAAAVVGWLVKHGIAAKRLTSKGYGPDTPIADNNTESGRLRNRRVEFKIIGGTDKKPAARGGRK